MFCPFVLTFAPPLWMYTAVSPLAKLLLALLFA